MQRLIAVFVVSVLCGMTSGRRVRNGAGTPVEKVVQLLKDLKTKIEQDGQSESQTYNKYACWVEETSKRKAANINQAREDLRALGQQMLTLKGKVATLIAEMAGLEKQIKENLDAQEMATALRQKNHADFEGTTSEMEEVLAALEKAITILRDATTMPKSFLQEGTTAAAAVRAVIRVLPARATLSPEQASFLDKAADFSVGSSEYAPQSLTVQGILKNMYDTFAKDLESAMQMEADQNRAFEDYIATQMEALDQLKKENSAKLEEKAKMEASLAEVTQMYDDTEAQMKADIAFFDELKAAANAKHSEWGQRSELRAEELYGITKALELLTTDAARELFADAIKPGKETHADDSYDPFAPGPVSLLQVADGSNRQETALPLSGAYSSLTAAARRSKSLRLATLAVKVREAKVGHFETVIKAIDTMMATLKDEEAADIAKRDQCISEYTKTNSTIANVTWLIKRNKAAIDKLEQTIAAHEAEKLATIQEIADIDSTLAAMLQQRQTENAAFLDAKTKDQDAISLLSEARDFLVAYYDKNNVTLGPLQAGIKALALAQQGPFFNISADEAPDAVFSGKGHRKNEAKSILQLLTMIIEDLTDEIKNGMKTEEQTQLAYEKEKAAAEKVRAQLVEKVTNLNVMIADRTTDKNNEEADLANNEKDLADEQEYRAKITPDCDWIIAAFAHRAERRAAEMEGLVGAKEFLAGYQKNSA